MPTRLKIALLGSVFVIGVCPTAANAGCFMDWLFGGRRSAPAYPIGSPVPVAGSPGTVQGFAPNYSANYGSYFGASQPVIGPMGAGYPAPAQGGITAATLPSQTPQPMFQPMTTVPNFGSSALRAPVTYYRPVMTTDPNTGAQVVSMMPCTSYQYMTQRVPIFGRTSLFGSFPPAMQPAVPPAVPTYTLPSGGIPLAQGNISGGVPPMSMGYGNTSGIPQIAGPHTSFSPPLTTSSGYATTPLNSSSYYGGGSGGSVGTIHSTPVPGLMAPPTPSSVPPLSATPSSPSDFGPSSTLPQGVFPDASSMTVPPTTSPSMVFPSTPTAPSNQVFPPSDPADTPPSLPENGLRPQLKSITPDYQSPYGEQTPNGGGFSEDPNQNGYSRGPGQSDLPKDFPVMSPIPAPEGLKKPRWNPGLLREEDMTALRPVTRADQYAGHSKKIVWASFEQAAQEESSDSNVKASDWNMELRPSQPASDSSRSSGSGLRDRVKPGPGAEVSYGSEVSTPQQHDAHPYENENKRYSNSGWRASP